MKNKKMALFLCALIAVSAAGYNFSEKCVQLISAEETDTEMTYEYEGFEFRYVKCEDGYSVTGAAGSLDYNPKIIIPDDINGVPVTEIAEKAFYCCESLSEIKLGNNIKRIGAEAFVCRGSINISEVHIPESVEEIGEKAIGYRRSSMSVPGIMTILDTETRIDGFKIYGSTDTARIYTEESNADHNDGVNTFLVYEDEGIIRDVKENMTFKDGVLNIGMLLAGADNYMAWREYADTAEEIVLAEGIDEIPAGAFSDFSSLKKITLPKSLVIIREKAFQDCISLEEISLPESVYYLGKSCFANCSSLRKVTAGDELRVISQAAFSYCSELESIDLSDRMTLLDHAVFNGCSKLSLTGLPAGLKMVFTDFTNNENIKKLVSDDVVQINIMGKYVNSSPAEDLKLTLADGVLTVSGTGVIPEGNLPYTDDMDDETIVKIVIEEGITGISKDNFTDERLMQVTDIVIADSVKYVGDNAFFSTYGSNSIIVRPEEGWQLKNIDFGNGIVYIGSKGFGVSYGAVNSIRSLPADLTYISSGGIIFNSLANTYQGGPVNVILPDGLSYIGSEGLAYMLRPTTLKPTYTEFIGSKNSYAYIYADEYRFKITEKPVYRYDCNRDNTVDAGDLVYALKYFNSTSDEIYYLTPDINQDGKTNILDLVILKSYLISGDESI